MARGVEKTIEDVKKARKHFDNFDRRFEDIGKGLRKAQEAFDTANTHLGHYESSVFRLVGELGTDQQAIADVAVSEAVAIPTRTKQLELPS